MHVIYDIVKIEVFWCKNCVHFTRNFFFKIYFSLVSALLPAVVLNYLPQVLILFKLSNKLHQLHISSIWSMAQTITYIHIVKLCSFCFYNNCVYCLSLPYNIKSLILLATFLQEADRVVPLRSKQKKTRQKITQNITKYYILF